MARKSTSRRGSTTDPVPTFDEDYLDVDHWPHRWRVEPRDLQPGERILDVFKALNGDDGPLIYPRCSEAEQLSFDSTCRKLHRFLTGPKSTSR
jgi:hypothetical protein